jgi:hypothetical protein
MEGGVTQRIRKSKGERKGHTHNKEREKKTERERERMIKERS